MRIDLTRFEENLSPNTLWLVQRLIRTEQAKTGLVIFMGKVMNIPDDEALRFFKRYKEYVNASPNSESVP